MTEDAAEEIQDTSKIGQRAPAYTETYIAGGTTEALFKECARQADYIIPQAFERGGDIPRTPDGEHIGEGGGFWYDKLGLTPCFQSWAQVTFVHLWLITVRMRYFPEEYSKTWLQHLHDHFFWEAEHRMNIFHKVTSSTIRNRYLKELYNMWLGVQGAYDEGLIRGDAVLATALWRNVFRSNQEVDWKDVALVTGFVRRGLRALDRASDRTIVAALIQFNSPASETPLVMRPSPLLNKPFSREDEVDVRKVVEQGKENEDEKKK